jgi:uncharacterized SAM-binding protein YcdF (DUF218 family)
MGGFLLQLTEPLAMVWFVMFIELCWLLSRRRWRPALCVGTPTLLLFLIGSTPLTDALVRNAEAEASTSSIPETSGGWEKKGGIRNGNHGLEDGRRGAGTVVVVLGGGYYVSDKDPYGFAVRDAGNRVLTALDLVRAENASALVFGGSPPIRGRPALVAPLLLEDWVGEESLARTATLVTNLGICMNTHDEAVQFGKLEKVYRWERVLLVTSALHMARSVGLFKKQGVDVRPVACDFKVYGVPGSEYRFSFLPNLMRIEVFGLYLHEKIGWWVYRARGWV